MQSGFVVIDSNFPDVQSSLRAGMWLMRSSQPNWIIKSLTSIRRIYFFCGPLKATDNGSPPKMASVHLHCVHSRSSIYSLLVVHSGVSCLGAPWKPAHSLHNRGLGKGAPEFFVSAITWKRPLWSNYRSHWARWGEWMGVENPFVSLEYFDCVYNFFLR